MQRNLIYYFNVSGETFCTERLLCRLSALGSRLSALGSLVAVCLLLFSATSAHAGQICRFSHELWFDPGEFPEYPKGYDGNAYESSDAALQAAKRAVFGPSGVFASRHTVNNPCEGIYQTMNLSFIAGDGVTPIPFDDSGSYVVPVGISALLVTATKNFCQRPYSVGSPFVVLSTRTYVYAPGNTLRCESADPQVISLSGPAETRPVGTAGSAPVTFTAKVSSGATPKVGVPITFAVELTPNSGGHEHHDVNRPKGKLSAVQGTTDANGEVKLMFTAPEVSGIHTIKATCATCSNSPAAKEIKVKVPDLIRIPADYETPPRYLLVGYFADASNGYEAAKHQQSHFVTRAGWRSLDTIIDTFLSLGWGQIGINDASLEWGGMFDIKGKWLKPVLNSAGKLVTGGHAEHRNGEQVDISFVRPIGVSTGLRQKAYKEVCNNNRTPLSPDILWHQTDGYAPHFHIYLTGRGSQLPAGQVNRCTQK